MHSWAVFTSLPTSVCLFFCLSGPVMHCNPSSGMGYSKALQLHYQGQYGGWKVLWLACSPTAGQYFQRLCDCSASVEICLHFPCHPSRPKQDKSALPLLSRITYPPLICATTWQTFHKGAPLCSPKVTPITLISFLFLYAAACSSMFLAI